MRNEQRTEPARRRAGKRCAIRYVGNYEAAKETQQLAQATGRPEPVLVRGDLGTDAAGLVSAAVDALGVGLGGLVTTAVPIVASRALSVTRDECLVDNPGHGADPGHGSEAEITSMQAVLNEVVKKDTDAATGRRVRNGGLLRLWNRANLSAAASPAARRRPAVSDSDRLDAGTHRHVHIHDGLADGPGRQIKTFPRVKDDGHRPGTTRTGEQR